MNRLISQTLPDASPDLTRLPLESNTMCLQRTAEHQCPFSRVKVLSNFYLGWISPSSRQPTSLCCHTERFRRSTKSQKVYHSAQSSCGAKQEEPRGWTECRVQRYYFTRVILVFGGWECGEGFHQSTGWVGLSPGQSKLPGAPSSSPVLLSHAHAHSQTLTDTHTSWIIDTYLCFSLCSFFVRLTLTRCRQNIRR